MRAACRAGASGFLAGRSIWAQARRHFPISSHAAGSSPIRGAVHAQLAGVVAAEGRAWRVDYADLEGIDREGALAAAVPALGGNSAGAGSAARRE